MFKKFIIKSDQSEVEEFNLKEFSLKVTSEATAFEKSELINNKGFIIDKSSSKKSGLSYLKDKRVSNKINEEVKLLLEEEKSKIYEKYKQMGYDEGFESGIVEGKDSVLEENKMAMDGALSALKKVTRELNLESKNLIKNNERDLIDLVKLATEKFCLKEIEINEELIKNIITETLENHVKAEKVNCLLSNEDFKKLTKFNQELKKNCLPQEISFESSNDVEDGGLVLELESGKIDKNVATRFKKIWDALDSNGN